MQAPLSSSLLVGSTDILSAWLSQRELLKSVKEEITKPPCFKGLDVALEAKPEWDGEDCYMGMTLSSGNDWVVWIGFWNLLQRKSNGETPILGHVYEESKLARRLFPTFWKCLKKMRAAGLVAPLAPGHGWPIPIPLDVIQGKTINEQAKNIVEHFIGVLNGGEKK